MSMTEKQANRLGALIAAARAAKGRSLSEVADDLGVHKSWVGFLEQGKYLDPAPIRLALLAELLDIDPSRIERITKGTLASSLPETRTYFRAKYDLEPEQIAKIERYIEKLRGPGVPEP